MIILNDDLSKVEKGGLKAPKISVDDFKKELLNFIRKYNPSDYIDIAEFMKSDDPLKTLKGPEIPIDYDPVVLKDLQKITFQHDNGAMHKVKDCPFHPNEFMGLHVTKTGLPFIGASGCGDEEWVEVFFILYFDGNRMRGYIPYYTNTYNPKTKAAFGLDNTDEDAEYLNEIGINCEYDEDSQEYNLDVLSDIRCDPAKLIYDIEQKIIVI